MDITVKGKAEKKFKPEIVRINLTFNYKDKKYEKSLENGTKMVNEFVDKVLKELNISVDELKTIRFSIVENSIYDPEKRKRVFDGYMFDQTSRFEFDYDVKKMAKFMELVSKMDNPPTYRIGFSLKDEDAKKNSVLQDAIDYAYAKAEAISKACKKELVDLIKLDFRPFDSVMLSSVSELGSNDYALCETSSMKMCSVASSVEQNFTPEDIYITEEVYCLFVAK